MTYTLRNHRYKINKKKLFILLFCIIQILGNAQTAEDNHEKYWFYRHRLINNFVKIGDCQGCSIPAEARGHSDFATLKWGDGNEWGWYIAVLATEYKLLTKNNQDASETIKELYYAIEAFNRVDYNTEIYASGGAQSGWLNGFFSANDVPIDFLGDPNDPNSNYNHFNSGLVESHCDQQYSQPCIVNNISTNFDPNNTGVPDPDIMSMDMVCHLLMGLALVNECVGDNITFNNTNFMDGENKIVAEAHNIADRIVSWIRIHSWFVYNPVTNQNVTLDKGGFAQLLSYGYAEAACKVTNKTDYTHLLYGLTCLDYHDQISIAGMSAFEAYNNPDVFFAIVHTSSYNDHLIGLLAAIGNSWYEPPSPPFWPINNATNASLSAYFTSAQYSRPYLPLLRQVLHGGGNLVSNSTYTDLLNSAPCKGPYNIDGNYPDYNWSTTNRFRQPEHRGESNPDPKGEYNGLDYMLLFNLYCLAQPDYLDDAFQSYYSAMDRVITVDYPYVLPFPPFVSQYFPREIDAFNTITADNHINAGGTSTTNGDVTYRAGRQIDLLPGFEVEAGAHFEAYIDPFQCDGNGDYVRTSGDTGNPRTIYNAPTNYVQYANTNNNNPTVSSSSLTTPSVSSGVSKSQDAKPASEFNITPNPSTGIFTIQMNNEQLSIVNYQLSIYNPLGQIIYQSSIINNQSSIDLSSQPSGIYFVKVQTADKIYTEKVVLQ